MQRSASQLRNVTQVRFNIYLIFHLYIYLIVFKVITGLFFVANFHSSTNLETKISTDFTTNKVASLQRFFHWRSLEQLSKILGAYSRQQTIGYNHILFNYVRIIYNMHVHISWCYKSSFVNISCQFVCLFVCLFFSLQVFSN